jgi:lactoylglutathione lyase
MTTPATSLGAFSLSLAVKDLTASRDFYRKLGFEAVGGKLEQNWLILRNGTATIGLFQGMFDRNMLTFNPGWDGQCAPLDRFTDVRAVQKQLEADGVVLATRAEEGTSGPASFVVVDPDGNPILVDQHV